MAIVSISTAKAKVVGEMEIDGTLYKVYQLNFDQNERVNTADLTLIHSVLRELIPDLPAEKLGKIGIDDAKVIIAYAGAGMKLVEAMFPNAVKPEGPTSAG